MGRRRVLQARRPFRRQELSGTIIPEPNTRQRESAARGLRIINALLGEENKEETSGIESSDAEVLNAFHSLSFVDLFEKFIPLHKEEPVMFDMKFIHEHDAPVCVRTNGDGDSMVLAGRKPYHVIDKLSVEGSGLVLRSVISRKYISRSSRIVGCSSDYSYIPSLRGKNLKNVPFELIPNIELCTLQLPHAISVHVNMFLFDDFLSQNKTFNYHLVAVIVSCFNAVKLYSSRLVGNEDGVPPELLRAFHEEAESLPTCMFTGGEGEVATFQQIDRANFSVRRELAAIYFYAFDKALNMIGNEFEQGSNLIPFLDEALVNAPSVVVIERSKFVDAAKALEKKTWVIATAAGLKSTWPNKPCCEVALLQPGQLSQAFFSNTIQVVNECKKLIREHTLFAESTVITLLDVGNTARPVQRTLSFLCSGFLAAKIGKKLLMCRKQDGYDPDAHPFNPVIAPQPLTEDERERIVGQFRTMFLTLPSERCESDDTFQTLSFDEQDEDYEAELDGETETSVDGASDVLDPEEFCAFAWNELGELINNANAVEGPAETLPSLPPQELVSYVEQLVSTMEAFYPQMGTSCIGNFWRCKMVFDVIFDEDDCVHLHIKKKDKCIQGIQIYMPTSRTDVMKHTHKRFIQKMSLLPSYMEIILNSSEEDQKTDRYLEYVKEAREMVTNMRQIFSNMFSSASKQDCRSVRFEMTYAFQNIHSDTLYLPFEDTRLDLANVIVTSNATEIFVYLKKCIICFFVPLVRFLMSVGQQLPASSLLRLEIKTGLYACTEFVVHLVSPQGFFGAMHRHFKPNPMEKKTWMVPARHRLAVTDQERDWTFLQWATKSSLLPSSRTFRTTQSYQLHISPSNAFMELLLQQDIFMVKEYAKAKTVIIHLLQTLGEQQGNQEHGVFDNLDYVRLSQLSNEDIALLYTQVSSQLSMLYEKAWLERIKDKAKRLRRTNVSVSERECLNRIIQEMQSCPRTIQDVEFWEGSFLKMGTQVEPKKVQKRNRTMITRSGKSECPIFHVTCAHLIFIIRCFS